MGRTRTLWGVPAELVSVWLLVLLALILYLPTGAQAAECSNTWTGAAEGTWQTASNWSAGHAPNSGDVACIGSGKTVNVTAGSNQAAVVQGEGTLKVKESTLEILSTTESSSIKNLTIQYNANLTGPATINVSNAFAWTNASTMSGTGATVLGPSAAGSITTGGGWATLKERRLVTEGTFAINEGIMALTEGAILENKGTLTINHEAGTFDILDNGGTNRPKLVNAGILRKTSGAGETKFDVAVENEGEVDAQTGTLGFTLVGASNVLASGSTMKGNFYFNKNSFAAGSFNASGATIKIREATVDVGSGSTATFGTLTMDYNALLTGSGTFEISKALTWSSDSKMSGSGSTTLKPSATAKVTTYWGRLAQRTFVNEGTFTLEGEGTVRASEGATFENEATVNANAVVSYARFPGFLAEAGAPAPLLVNNGMIQKTVGTSDTRMNLNVENNETIDVKTGRLLFNQAGATATLTSGSEIKGNTRFELTKIVGTDFTVPNGILEARESAIQFEGKSTSIANFKMEYGTVVSGAGDVLVPQSFDWHGQSTLGGTGTMTLGPGSSNVLNSGATVATLSQRILVNEGAFTQTGSSKLSLAAGATFKNKNTYNLNSEPYPTWVRDSIRSEVGPALNRFINIGVFQRTEGTRALEVLPGFENRGEVNPISGKIEIKNPISVLDSERFGFRCHCGDPVETASGDLVESQTDIAVGGLGVGLVLTRSYSAQAAATAIVPGIFGYGWTSSFGDRLRVELEGTKITVERGDGSTVPFLSDGNGAFDPPAWSEDTLTGNAETGYTYRGADQIEYRFAPAGELQSVTDRNGNETTLTYTEAGRLEAIEDPAGREVTLTYNGEGLVEKAEDPMGHIVQYAYEGKELTGVTMPSEEGPRWQFDYDGSHRMTTMTDGRGGKTVNKYDAASRVSSQTDPVGRTLTFVYDGFHTTFTNEKTGAVTDMWFNSDNQPISITRGYGTEYATTERYAYDEAGHQISRIDGNGHTTTFTYNAAGDRTSMTDTEESKTEWTYNATHDVISETTPKGETTTIVRDVAGNPETVSRPALGGATQTIGYGYDALGQLESITDPLERTWIYEYDAKGNLEAKTDPEGNTRSWGYDENSQVISIVSPRGNEEGAEPSEFTTTIQRDPQGRPEKVVDPLGHDTEFAYDGNGNLESETNAKGKTTQFVYNGAGELIETKKPNGAVLKTEYDGAGGVVAQIDGREKKTTYVRNVLEQPIEVIDPLSRKTVQDFDDAGYLQTVVDQAERITSYAYDSAGRIEEILYSDEATPDVSFEYDPDGNLVRMVDGSGESTYVYDQLGRLEETTNGHGDTISYEYNLAGQQGKVVYPNGKDVERTFDDAGRLESVSDWLGGTISFVYDADSDIEAIQFPAGSGNVDEFSYDQAGRMSSVSFEKGAESLASIAYERDPLGQMEAIVSEGLPGPEEESYEYDDDNHLVKAGAEAFEYDKADNPIKTPGSTNAFDDASQLETGTGVAYEYNPIGERVKATPSSGPATSYAYNQAGNLTSVKRAAEGETPSIDVSFTSDGSGLLASRTSGLSTKYYAWDVGTPLPLLLNDGVNSYVYGPDGLPIIQIDAEEEPTYLHHDQLGSTRLLTGATGEATGSFAYTAYGDRAAEAGIAETPLGYAGQYTDVETGLQYLRARFYDPATAQFLGPDPLRALTQLPYGYAHGNPVNGVDPSGLIGLDDVGNFFKGTAESLNPIKYYEEEIECIEEGCSYWESVFKGSQGAVTAACDLTGVGALGKGLLGRGGSAIAKEAAGAIAGSTGRTEAASLAEQLAMQAAKSNPAAGRVLEVTMSDARWPASAGWVKMAQNVNGVEIHYVYNARTGLATDFKFVP
jgi:RHS repeat-associated protein